MNKICVVCKTPYESTNNRSKTCSRKCFQKHRRDYIHSYNRKNFKNVILEALRKIKGRARLKGFEYNLDFNYIWKVFKYQKGTCLQTNIPLEISSGHGLANRSPWGFSIDRIDNDEGYVKGNIQIVSNMYNMCKSTWKHEDIIKFCKELLNNQ